MVGDFTRADATGRNRAVERSYFAAGVLANMLLCEQWPQGARLSREDVNERMVRSIRKWPMLPVPMVSYRCVYVLKSALSHVKERL